MPQIFVQGLHGVAICAAAYLLWRRRDKVAVCVGFLALLTWPWRPIDGGVPGLQSALTSVLLVLLVGRLLKSGAPDGGSDAAPETTAEDYQRAMEILRVSEEKFAKAFESSPDAITLSTLDDGKFHEVNPSFQLITGYHRSEALGKTSGDLGLWTDTADRQRLVDAIHHGGHVRDLETTFRRKDGGLRRCQIAAEVIELDGEDNLLFIVRDITERQQAEAERNRFVTELEAKNAELERFAYTVSHDLRSPLVTIQGFLGALRKDAKSGNLERMEQDAERIARAAATMQQLLDELLQLSRIGRVANTPREVDMVGLAGEACELLAGIIDQVGLTVDIQSDLPAAWGDRPRILEVLQNLLDNAAKFAGSHPQPRVHVGWRWSDDGSKPVYCVADNGIGIAEPYHEKIFGLFERLSLDVQGTGIGLALVKRIVEVHGGRIWVESDGLGHGSTFCFTLANRPSELPAESH